MANKRHTIRFATDDDGEAIKDLCFTCGYDPAGLSWTNLHPYWIVAVRPQDGVILGATQVCYGRPMGRLDLTGISQEIEGHYAAAVLRDLVAAGVLALRQNGAQTVDGFVSFDRPNMKRFYRKFGALPIAQGNLIQLRVA